MAGVLKPPMQWYYGGFLDIQSMIHYHVTRHYQNNTKRQLGDTDDQDDYLSTAEQSLLYGHSTYQDLILPDLIFPLLAPTSVLLLETHLTWFLPNFLQKVCAICNRYRSFYWELKDLKWCASLPSYLQHVLGNDVDKTSFLVALGKLFLLPPTITDLETGKEEVCNLTEIYYLMEEFPLTIGQRNVVIGVLMKALVDWGKATTRKLREEIIPIRFLESGMPEK